MCATRSRRSGALVFWRVAIKPGRPVAMGVIPAIGTASGAAFVGLPGNPVAVFVTFARVVRPLLLRLAGAHARAADGAAGARGVLLPQEEGPPRICAGGAARAPRTARVEAVKHPQEGAGVITSLTETDGLAELPEDMTTVEPGTTVGFLSYGDADVARMSAANPGDARAIAQPIRVSPGLRPHRRQNWRLEYQSLPTRLWPASVTRAPVGRVGLVGRSPGAVERIHGDRRR